MRVRPFYDIPECLLIHSEQSNVDLKRSSIPLYTEKYILHGIGQRACWVVMKNWSKQKRAFANTIVLYMCATR